MLPPTSPPFSPNCVLSDTATEREHARAEPTTPPSPLVVEIILGWLLGTHAGDSLYTPLTCALRRSELGVFPWLMVGHGHGLSLIPGVPSGESTLICVWAHVCS